MSCNECGGSVEVIEAGGDQRVPSLCSDCRNSSPVEKRRAEVYDFAREVDFRDKFLEGAGLPKRFLLDPTSPNEKLKGFIDRQYPRTDCMLFLHGVPNVGKTYEACALLRAWSHRQYVEKGEDPDVYFVTTPGLIKGVKSGDMDWRKVAYADFLVIDDAGAEAANWLSAEHVGELFDAREKCCMPTIVTSNMTPRQLYDGGRGYDSGHDCYDGRVFRRIKTATGGGEWVVCINPGDLYDG